MSFAKRISDKVMFMDGGKVVDYGTPEEVFNSNKEVTRNFLKSFF